MGANLDQITAEILADPDSDAPRLRYADVVGGDRAELIRLGIDRRDLRRKRVDETYVLPTQEKIATIVKRHREWAADVLPLVDWVEYGRGFVERVSLTAAKFLQTAPTLYAKAPILHVKLTHAKPHMNELAASPHLARLRSLDLSENALEDGEAIALAQSPHLARLRWLDLARNRIGAAGLDALAAATARRLPELAYLGFLLNDMPDPSPSPIEDDTGRITFREPLEGQPLEAKYGKLEWLHHYSETLPEPEAFY